jgi:acyl carrier protein phosphodiesterase
VVNDLAHALLSQPDPSALIGNVTGDYVKGPLHAQALHPRVLAGVRRHRRVDALTDAHPAYRRALARFPTGERRFAGIALDLAFDYFLISNWSNFTAVPFRAFRQRVYRSLGAYPERLPPRFAGMARRWVDADWLCACASLDGVSAVLMRLAVRRGRPMPVAALMGTLYCEQEELEADFLQVFSDVAASLPPHSNRFCERVAGS